MNKEYTVKFKLNAETIAALHPRDALTIRKIIESQMPSGESGDCPSEVFFAIQQRSEVKSKRKKRDNKA